MLNLFKRKEKKDTAKKDLAALEKECDQATEYLLKCNQELLEQLEQAQKA